MIATAGTVNTGAIDDLPALADLARAKDLWLHVDGCIGALHRHRAHRTPTASPASRRRIRSRSIRTNGCTRRSRWAAPWSGMRRRIATPSRSRRNIWSRRRAASPPGEWLHEYGLQTSRGFRALKVWMALKEHGVEKFGRLIDQNIAQAASLERVDRGRARAGTGRADRRSTSSASAIRLAGLDDAALKALNTEIMLRLQEEGIAGVSDTTVQGEHCLRVAINNHRTRAEDLDVLVRETVRIGRQIAGHGVPHDCRPESGARWT